jgi:hypothetical protein
MDMAGLGLNMTKLAQVDMANILAVTLPPTTVACQISNWDLH